MGMTNNTTNYEHLRDQYDESDEYQEDFGTWLCDPDNEGLEHDDWYDSHDYHLCVKRWGIPHGDTPTN